MRRPAARNMLARLPDSANLAVVERDRISSQSQEYGTGGTALVWQRLSMFALRALLLGASSF